MLNHIAAWAACRSCVLHSNRVVPLYGFGCEQAALLVLFDRHDIEMVDSCMVDCDDAGQLRLLRQLAAAADVPMSDLWITTPTLCPTTTVDPEAFPPRETAPAPKAKGLAACRPRLLHEAHQLQPEVILCCGAGAINALWSKKKPSIANDLGTVVECMVAGDLVEYPVPAFITYSYHALFATPDLTKDGTWFTACNHLASAYALALELRSKR